MGEGGILFYLCPSFRPSKIFFVAFFSVTVDGRNLIFGPVRFLLPVCRLSWFLYTFNRQTGSRNLMGPKTLPTIWGTYMKLVTKYQISGINSCWEKCAYMFNVYKNQQSRHTGSRNLTGPKTLSTIWHTYMKLVNKYLYTHLTYICICTFFVAFFSATIDDRNLIFVHKLHIGMPYCGKRFWTRQIPTSCLPT
jgi:hypothetical protein